MANAAADDANAAADPAHAEAGGGGAGVPEAAVDAVWRALRDHLVRCGQEIAVELRHYPSPIAGCDQQLPKLIEQRRALWRQLDAMEAADADGGAAHRRAACLALFLRSAPLSDDADDAALRARVAAALRAGP